MSRGKENLFSEDQLHIIQDQPEEVNSKHRSTHRESVEMTVNNAVVQAIEYFPLLPEFMTSETKERLRLQTHPRNLTQPIGDIYPDHTTHAIAGLVLNEKGEDESGEEFLERLDDLWDDIKRDVRHELETAGVSFKVERTRYQFKRQLVDRLTSRLYDPEKWAFGMARVSIPDLIDWILDHEPTTEMESLPGLLDLLFDRGATLPDPSVVEDYWDELTTIAAQQGIAPPSGEEWSFDFTNPTLTDFGRHTSALDGLTDEIDWAIERYMDERNIVGKAILVTIGLSHLSRLKRRDLTILESAPCSNKDSGWNHYDTRRASQMAADGGVVSLLDETVTPKSDTDEKAYRRTELGTFVLRLSRYISYTSRVETIESDDIDEILPTVHLSELPQETMENAIDEIDPLGDPTYWEKVELSVVESIERSSKPSGS